VSAAGTREVSARKSAEFAEHYSPRNEALLRLAGATEVAGYREWQQLGRQVRKGEHGIKITAPVTVKDSETGEARIVNTQTATVFDVSQTDPIAAEVAA
jgi:antirestriction protein ArdC